MNSDGIVVLDAEWILDSLDIQKLLPDKHYSVQGLPLSGISWSTRQSYLTKLDPMKWLLNSLWSTSTSKRTKRVFEGEAELQSRKKRVSVAINDVETALSRLREVTGNEASKMSPSQLKSKMPSHEITAGLPVVEDEERSSSKADLSESQPESVKIEEERESLDDGDYVTAQESDSVKVEEEQEQEQEVDLETLLYGFECPQPESRVSSVKSESPDLTNSYEPLGFPQEWDEFGSGDEEHLTDLILSDEMEESDDDEEIKGGNRGYEGSESNVAWDTPNTSNKDDSEDEDGNWKCYKSLVNARTSFEPSTNIGGSRRGYDRGSREAVCGRRNNEEENASEDESEEKEKNGGYQSSKVHRPTVRQYTALSPVRKCDEDTTKKAYSGTPEIEVGIANPITYCLQSDHNNLITSPWVRQLDSEDKYPPISTGAQDAVLQCVNNIRQISNGILDYSDGSSSSSKSSQNPPGFSSSWHKRNKAGPLPSSPSLGSPSLDTFSDGQEQRKCPTPSPLPCLPTQEHSPVSNYTSPKEPQRCPGPSPQTNALPKSTIDNDLIEYNHNHPRVSSPPPTNFTPINDKSPLSFPHLSSVPKVDRSLFAAERFSSFITPRSPARKARLESASKLSTLLNHLASEDLSTCSEDIYMPNLKSSSPELTAVLDPLRIRLGSRVLSGEWDGAGIQVWEAKCLEMGKDKIRVKRIGESVRDCSEISL